MCQKIYHLINDLNNLYINYSNLKTFILVKVYFKYKYNYIV